MKRLGNTNLFTSHFIMGCCESELKFTKTHTIEIEVLHKWMYYKDSDWGMKKYQTKRTQYISFPHLIDLQDLSLIIQDLMRIYKLQYPYATKEDFIDTVFGYSIFDIKNFIESEYTWYGGCPNIKEFDFYYTYERIGSELIDFILDGDKDIDYYKQYFKKVLQLIEDIEYNPIALVPLADEQKETKTEQEQPKTFEELFYNPEHAEPCLRILSELQPPFIDGKNNYIGKAKGVFPLWVMVLKSHKPEPLIKHFKDTIYKDLLNQKVKGLNLTKDASEFRKRYKRLENDKIELDIKTILSQYSQSGKLGK
jgi:hypothetical protein